MFVLPGKLLAGEIGSSAGEIGLGVGGNQQLHFGDPEFKIHIKITCTLEHPSWYFPSACLVKEYKT